MICRSCLLLRASAASNLTTATTAARLTLLPRRAFTLTSAFRADSNAKPPSLADTATPPLSTPSLSDGPVDAATVLKGPAPPKSSCLPGTPLDGLNYFKDRQDPVALPDEEYPDWLWTILDRTEKEVGTGDAGEFSKSRKERKLAAKKARLREEIAIASGNLDALAPKIPLQHQSINLPGNEGGSIADAIAAAQAREQLRRAMRKERMVTIREQNYLSTL